MTPRAAVRRVNVRGERPVTPAPPDDHPAGIARLAAELRVVRMVWRREMLHFVRDRARAVVSLLQPMLFLFVLGVGLARLFTDSGGAYGSGADYLMFLFPGVLVMAAQVPAISVGASIVWDRQSGFLREMLVTPARRETLLIGKCLGGTTVATCQGAVVLATAGLVHIPYRTGLFALLLAELALTSLALTALGAMVAVTIRRIQTFNTVLTVLITPLIFLSGLMFPIKAMPSWMAALSLANPLTYAVDVMRRTITACLPPRRGHALAEPVAWGSWHPSLPLEVAVVALFTVVALAVAGRRFARTG
ncbi:MAG TPA: ABC transporter permease [Streptosporangiaceae bacterium]|nr:ABC transporter permease [Streptosporangiaceae bacterium]